MFPNFIETFRDEEGQGLIEYAMIIMLVALVVIGVLTVLGQNVSAVFNSMSSGFGGS